MVFAPEMLMATGTGFVSPDAALGVVPGVIVKVQLLHGAMVSHVELIVVPAGRAGDKEKLTEFAALGPVFVMVMIRGVPVNAAFNAVSLTERASEETLAESVVRSLPL